MKISRGRRSVASLVSSLTLAAALAAVAGCEQPPEGGESGELALITAAVTQVPSNGTCVRFTTTAGTQTIQQTFDGTTGMPLTATLRGLPYGKSLSVSAEAFTGLCSALKVTSLATYMSDVQTVTLTAGQTKALSFTLRPTGNITTTTDFLYITINQTTKDFGPVVIGQQSPVWNLSITNIGMVATSALVTTPIGSTADFQIPTNTCGTLAAGATCDIQVKLVPVTAGPKNLQLTVAADLGGTVMASATGIGWTPAKLVATPPTLNFGSVPAFTQTAPMIVTLENQGDQPANAVVVNLPSPDFTQSSACPPMLPGHQSCQIQVRLMNSAVLGPRSAIMTINGSPGGTTTVSMMAVTTSPLTITPTSYNYGNSPINVVGYEAVFNVANTSTSTAPLFNVSVSNPVFKITYNSCSTTPLPPNTGCQVGIRFDPTTRTTQNATLIVGAPAPSLYTVQATLTGTGV